MQQLQQIKKGKADTITVVTPEIIEQIPKVKLFNNSGMDLKLYNLHKKIIRYFYEKE